MQSSQASPSTGNPALRFGAIFGLTWGVVLVANYYASQQLSIGWSGLAAVVISLLVYLVAGMLAAQQTGKVSTGLVAGLFTGIFSSLINVVGVVVILILNPSIVNKARQVAQQTVQSAGANFTYTNSMIIGFAVVGLILGLLLAGGVGLGMGALGGVIGRSRAPQAQVPYQDSMHLGMMPPTPYGAPGYPQYPQGQMPAYPPPPGAYPPPGGWPQQPPPQSPGPDAPTQP